MPGGKGNINGTDGNTFSSTNQPANRGRKKKIYTILKEKGFSADDIRTAFGEISWYDEDELKKIKEDIKKPIIVRIIANQLIQALETNDWNKIREIIEHLIGKPNQPLEHKGEVNINGAREKLIEALKNAAGDSGINKESSPD